MKKKILWKVLVCIAIAIIIILCLAYLPNSIAKVFTKTPGKTVATENLKEIVKVTKEDIQGEGQPELKTAIDDKYTSAELIPVIYLYSKDGDTLVINYEKQEITVRLIGIDTPESVNPDESLNTAEGSLASEHTKELMEEYKDKTIYLELDEEHFDKYDRLLAYVWLSENTYDTFQMLNAVILDDGYANVMTIEPNDKYKTTFESLYNGAVEGRRGLWN